MSRFSYCLFSFLDDSAAWADENSREYNDEFSLARYYPEFTHFPEILKFVTCKPPNDSDCNKNCYTRENVQEATELSLAATTAGPRQR